MPASCADGVRNGDEEGVDCGGSLCSACFQTSGIAAEPGSSSRADCRCDAGYTGAVGGPCEVCPAGWYKEGLGEG
eukprot:1613467-Rhodomonas_salina.1